MPCERWAIDELTETAVTVLYSGTEHSEELHTWMRVGSAPRIQVEILDLERTALGAGWEEEAIVVDRRQLNRFLTPAIHASVSLQKSSLSPGDYDSELVAAVAREVREGDVYWVDSLPRRRAPHYWLSRIRRRPFHGVVWDATAAARQASKDIYTRLVKAAEARSRVRNEPNELEDARG